MAKRTESKIGVLNYDNPIFFDLETTGTDYGRHQIIQIAAHHPSTDRWFERKLKFNRDSADPKALDAISFDMEVWKREAVSQREGLQDFADWMEEFRDLERISIRGASYRVVAMAGFRIDRFDVPFLIHHFSRRNIFSPFDMRVYDVQQLVMWMFPGLEDMTLEGIARELGSWKEGAHDARVDVEMTEAVCKVCLNEIFDEDSLPEWAKI